MKSHLPESSRPTISWDTHNPDQPAIHDDGRREPRRANQALLDYLHLGPGRSITGLSEVYRNQDSLPTRSINTLRMWSSQYNWPYCAFNFDKKEKEKVQAEYSAQRAEILRSGLALDHQRIEQINSLYKKIFELVQDEDAFWVKSVKTIHLGAGQFERIESRRFNGEPIRVLRGLLDDFARETGGRSSNLQLPDPAGLNIDHYSLDVFSKEEQETFSRLQNKLFCNPVTGQFLPQNYD